MKCVWLYSIGIDLGIKELATVSSIEEAIGNINKTKEVRRLKKKLKRKQRQISRKYEKNKIVKRKEGENRYIFMKTKNTEKLKKQTRLIIKNSCGGFKRKRYDEEWSIYAPTFVKSDL